MYQTHQRPSTFITAYDGKLIEKRTGCSLGKLRRNGFVAGRRYSAGAELEWFLTEKGGEPVGGWRDGSG